MTRARAIYILHQGSRNEHFYSFHIEPPIVMTKMVKDGETGEMIPIYMTPTPFVFITCIYGFERRLKLRVPLGSYLKTTLTIDELVSPDLSTGPERVQDII